MPRTRGADIRSQAKRIDAVKEEWMMLMMDHVDWEVWNGDRVVAWVGQRKGSRGIEESEDSEVTVAKGGMACEGQLKKDGCLSVI